MEIALSKLTLHLLRGEIIIRSRRASFLSNAFCRPCCACTRLSETIFRLRRVNLESEPSDERRVALDLGPECESSFGWRCSRGRCVLDSQDVPKIAA